MNQDLWVVKYSPDRNCFSVDVLRRALEENVTTLYDKRGTGDILLSVDSTKEEAINYMKLWTGRVKK